MNTLKKILLILTITNLFLVILILFFGIRFSTDIRVDCSQWAEIKSETGVIYSERICTGN